MTKTVLTYENHIPNSEIKKGDIFHGIYEVLSEPKITACGYEWMIRHQKWMLGKNYDGGVVLRMIRPDPSVYLAMDELEQSGIVTDYQRHFIPLQLHPYFEAFYDVRHIGGSSALFTEWSNRGTLAECMSNGWLYHIENAGDLEYFNVINRMLEIARHTARALQFMEEQGIWHGEVIAENIMLSALRSDFSVTAKLSVANLLTKRRQIPQQSDMKQWAEVMMDMLVGQKLYSELHDKNGEEEEEGKILSTVIADVLSGKLTDWKDIMVGLGEEQETDYHITRNGSLTQYEGYLNNFALRLVDAGKKEDALRVLEEARGPEQDFYFDISAIADTNMRKIRQNWGLPLKLYREFDSCSEPVVYMEEMMDAYFDLKETE